MKKVLMLTVLSIAFLIGCNGVQDQEQSLVEFRSIRVDEYLDKMKAGWVGQMAGVGWGGPTEFKWKGAIIPAEKMPKWTPEKINQFGQDDIYVEMTFIRTLEQYGFDVDIRQAGIDFANSGYGLAHANHYGRENLRKGIAPPDSGHPQFTDHADDIDYQIEADYSGLIAPGMPNLVIELGEKFGRLMNYGDGLYGGQFVGGMYAEAFFEKDMDKIVRAGLACVPQGSQFHECISDVIKWHSENPNDWQKTWHLIEAKYQDNPDYRKASCDKGAFNIDAKINAAYIVMGLLYGEGDIDKTIIISTRCGQDSDCNPSNAGGVLCTMIGFKDLPDKFTSALNPNGKFSHSPYTFPKMIEVSAQLVRDAVKRQGGRIEKDADGKEIFVIAAQTPKPSKLEQCWEPAPIASSKFTDAEMKKIKYAAAFPIGKIFHGWRITDCGKKMNPGLRDEFGGKKNVIVTHPVDRETGAKVFRNIWVVPKNKKTTLTLVVGHHPKGDWDLIVKKKHGKELFRTPVSKDTAKDGWLKVEVDLSELAGKRARIELVNQSNGGKYEAGYWAKMDIVSEQSSAEFRSISVDEYLDKMKAGWIGQMAGVSWGYPTEFKCRGKIMPPDLVPEWSPKMVNNAFGQDDIYVEMTFLRTLELYGLDASIRQAGIDFANTGYRLWWENKGCRRNLRLGIAPPSCSHPEFNPNGDGIGYQIQSDFSGLISPGLPGRVIGVGEVFGRVTNYGDGLYAGQFVGGMYAEAFFETDMVKVVKAGLKCIPKESQYAEMVRDMLAWYHKNPDDWKKTWQLCEDKYQLNPQYNRCKSLLSLGYNIHAKLNGAYIVMGLLYGKGDIDQTVIISMRCGQDSDCNPSNAAGVLFTTMGFSNLPEKFKSALNPEAKFSHTPYTFPRLTEVCEMLARKIVAAEGGKIEKDEKGAEMFVIPVRDPKPGELEQSWEPGPDTNSKFTDAEMKKIKYAAAFPIGKTFHGWRITDCGKKMNPGLRDKFRGKKNIIVTHPVDRETGAKVFRNIWVVPKNKKTTLTLVVGHHPKGDWDLIVKLKHGKELFRTPVSKDTAKDGWLETEVDLSEFAGTRVKIELVNQSNGGKYEAGYWAKIDVVSE